MTITLVNDIDNDSNDNKLITMTMTLASDNHNDNSDNKL